MHIKNKKYLFWKWATVAVLGNGSAAPRFGSLVSSTNRFQMGEWIQMGTEWTQRTPWGMAWKNMGIAEKVYGVTKRKWQKFCFWNGQKVTQKCFGGVLHNVFIGWSKGFWPMVFYFPWHLSMFFLPILIFRVFYPFLERVRISHNKCSSSLHLWEMNNDVLDHI